MRARSLTFSASTALRAAGFPFSGLSPSGGFLFGCEKVLAGRRVVQPQCLTLQMETPGQRITGRTSTELRFHWVGGNFVYNRHGPDFAEDAGGEPSSPVRKGKRRRE